MVNDATIIGLMMGSLLASRIVTKGRLRAVYIANFIIMIGCLPQMLLSMWCFILGRLIVGFGSGLLLVTTSVYMSETLPGNSVEKCLTSLNLGINVGILLITLL